MMPEVGANLVGEQRMLQRQVGAEHQEGLALVQVGHGGEFALRCR